MTSPPYILKKSLFIKKPIQEVFSFFENPQNLEKITPPNLNFQILTLPPLEMKKDAIFDYLVRPLFFPLKWRSRMTEYEPPHRFVDVQLGGPYSYWHHTHSFMEKDGGTLIEDDVRYVLPFGVLGKLAHWVHVKKKLEHIFEFRKKVIQTYFDKGSF